MTLSYHLPLDTASDHMKRKDKEINKKNKSPLMTTTIGTTQNTENLAPPLHLLLFDLPPTQYPPPQCNVLSFISKKYSALQHAAWLCNATVALYAFPALQYTTFVNLLCNVLRLRICFATPLQRPTSVNLLCNALLCLATLYID